MPHRAIKAKRLPSLEKIDLGYRRNKSLKQYKATSDFNGDETEWKNEWL